MLVGCLVYSEKFSPSPSFNPETAGEADSQEGVRTVDAQHQHGKQPWKEDRGQSPQLVEIEEISTRTASLSVCLWCGGNSFIILSVAT